MKKYLFMFIFAFSLFFGFSFSNIEAKTVNTDLGDVNFDLEQIQQENPTLNLGEDYIIAKRKNLTDVILTINIDNNYLSSFYNYVDNCNNSGYSCFTRSNIYVFVYNFTNDEFEYFGIYDSGSSFGHSNLIYDASMNSVKYMDNVNWYNVNLVTNGNYYNFDFVNKIFLFNNIFYEDRQDLITNDVNVLDFTNNSSYTSELANYNSNRLSNINDFNTDSANLIKGNTWQQYGQYYFSIGYRNYFSNSPDFIKLGYYKNKNTGQYEYSFIVDVSKTVYFYNTLNSSFRFKLMSSTNTSGWAVPRFFGSLITDINSTDNVPFFTNLPQINLMDNVSLSLYDKNFSPGSTVFVTDNNNIVYLDGYYNPIPKVTFNSTYNTNSNNNNVSITVNAVFDNFDVENYKYYYKSNTDSEWIILAYNQQLIDTKTFTKTFYENGNFAIKVSDMEDNALATYTYQWNEIDTKNGVVTSFGNNSFGINSRYISIMSGLASTNKIFDTITCEEDRPFSDNTCFVNFNDFDTDVDDYLNSVLGFSVVFNENYSSIPLESGKYYLLNYRVFSDFSFTPNVLRLISGSSNIPSTILDIDVKEHGIYKDYVITFETTSNEQDLAITGIQVIFSNMRDLTDSISDNFKFGVYNSFKIQQYNNQPTDTDINNFYNKNSLDSISRGDPVDFFTSFTINDFGLASIIKKPLDLLSYVVSEEACSPIEIPFPNSNEVITLPCLQSVLSDKLGILFNILQIIFSGLICYRVGLGVFRTLKDLINPKNDKIEVVDL